MSVVPITWKQVAPDGLVRVVRMWTLLVGVAHPVDGDALTARAPPAQLLADEDARTVVDRVTERQNPVENNSL